ncbi:hypothetical protein C8D88_11667 [Lentzea atacamensis]|uniref:Uncharacterized protein n=1 Tax=Lentzea atacamensis TaxID=531938 RepID=A0A316HK94_9PSEU|nr:hypothetical protein [Lentzea atacamensis]PWK81656.1 hypothetical protein C8D88_11667 [Lentzea atacamensis]
MSDLIGTIRREEHEGGFSIWAKVAQAQVHAFNPVRTVVAAEWLCVYSTAEGNCGERLHRMFVERDANPVVGFVPGTPAAEQAVTT